MCSGSSAHERRFSREEIKAPDGGRLFLDFVREAHLPAACPIVLLLPVGGVDAEILKNRVLKWA